MQLLDKIIEKLTASAKRPYLIKRFDFTLEDIHDNPEYINVIINFLEFHNGKWDDFDILAEIDSNTFKPYVLLILYLNKDLSAYAIPTELTLLKNLNI